MAEGEKERGNNMRAHAWRMDEVWYERERHVSTPKKETTNTTAHLSTHCISNCFVLGFSSLGFGTCLLEFTCRSVLECVQFCVCRRPFPLLFFSLLVLSPRRFAPTQHSEGQPSKGLVSPKAFARKQHQHQQQRRKARRRVDEGRLLTYLYITLPVRFFSIEPQVVGSVRHSLRRVVQSGR